MSDVTIIISNYNYVKYVASCIQSALNQTYYSSSFVEFEKSVNIFREGRSEFLPFHKGRGFLRSKTYELV
jgi:GT2 family glycosyltransferase